MDRRRALAAVAACFGALHSLGVQAQQAKLRRVGFFSAASAAANAPRLAAFRQGMTELGWVEGKDYLIDARYAEGAGANISQVAADAVASRPDVILTPSDDAVLALLNSSKLIPIVFATASNPLSYPTVKNLQRPGGNATGLASLRGPLAAKGVQLLKEAFPEVKHIALLVGEGMGSTTLAKEIEAAALKLGVRVSRMLVKKPEDIGSAVKRAASGVQAFVIADGFMFISNRKPLVEAISASKLPAVYSRTEYVEQGGLMSYAASTQDNFRRAAVYVDKILKGANPGDLPIEQPSKFELSVNLKTAKAIGITVPTSLLVRADKVIQ